MGGDSRKDFVLATAGNYFGVSSQDSAALFALSKERDELKEQLAELQRPSRDDIVAELGSLRSQLAAFDPEVGMLTGMSMPGGGEGPERCGDRRP